MPPERPPLPSRDRGNSDRAPRAPWGGNWPASGLTSWLPRHSFFLHFRKEIGNRPDFIAAGARIGLSDIAHELQDLFEIVRVEDVKSKELFLGLGEWSVQYQGF